MSRHTYISDQLKSFSERGQAKYEDLFKLLNRVNANAIGLLDEFSVEADDIQGILVGGYFSRCIENAQGAVLLSENGLIIQGRIVLRAALESQFSLRACLSYAFCERLVASDMVKKNKMLRKFEQLSKMSKVRGLDEMLASKNVTKFREDVAQIEANDIPIIEIAKAAGCHDLNMGAYATLSSSAHSSVHDIESRVVYSNDGLRVATFSSAPRFEDMAFVLVSAIEVLLDASLATCAFLEKDCTADLTREHDALRELADKALLADHPIR